MKRFRDCLISALCLIALLMTSAIGKAADLPVGDAETEGLSQTSLDQARQIIRDQISAGTVDGGLHLVIKNNKIVHFSVDGYADLQKKQAYTADSIMRIYSMSKPIVSVAAMTLWEAGKFKLDDPLYKYIPEFKRVQVLDNSGNTHKFLDPIRPILVRDLFRHTSGITYCRHSDEEHTQPYYEKEGLFYHGPEEIYPPNMTTEEGVRRLARIPLLHDPGKKFSYGFNTDILGRLVEIWSGLPLDQYVDRSICKPLGMVDTAFFVPQEKVDRFASLHARRNGKLTVIASGKDSPYIKGFKWISGGGGLVSTALDYGRFCLMVLNGGAYHGHRVLKSRTVSLLFTDQLSPATGPVKFGERVSAQGFGLGFALKDIVLGSGSLERPSTTYTWGGYANTSFDIIPDANLIQVFFRQEVPSNNELSKMVFDIVNRGVKE